MFLLRKIVLLNFFFIFFYVFSFSTSYSLDTKNNSYGLSVYKRGNCMGCHSWHGKGGGGYGAGVSLRMSKLNFNELVEIIKCGRPGSGMPYFYKKSYLEEKCYDTFITDYTDDNFKPISSKKFLNSRQVNAVASFIIDNLQGKTLDKAYCENFFEKGSKVCEKL